MRYNFREIEHILDMLKPARKRRPKKRTKKRRYKTKWDGLYGAKKNKSNMSGNR